MANLKDFKDFDPKAYDNYIRLNDFFGAINYIREFKPVNERAARQIDSEVDKLRTQGLIYERTMNDPNIGSDTKQAFQFMTAVKNGAKLEDYKNNRFATQFIDNYKNVVDKLIKSHDSIIFDNNKHINYFAGIDFLSSDEDLPETGFELFCNRLGVSTDKEKRFAELKNLGINYETDSDGRTIVKLSNTGDFDNNLRILKALYETDDNHSIELGDKVKHEDWSKSDATYRWELASRHSGSRDWDTLLSNNDSKLIDKANELGINLTNLDEKSLDRLRRLNTIPATPLSAIGNVTGNAIKEVTGLAKASFKGLADLFNSNTLDNQLKDLMDIYTSSENIYKRLMSSGEEVLTGDFQTYNYNTVNSAENERAYQAREITEQDYKHNKEDITNSILSALKSGTKDYLEANIYVVDNYNENEQDPTSTNMVLSKINNVDEITEIIQLLNINLKDNLFNVDEDMRFATAPGGDGYLLTLNAHPEYAKNHYLSNVRRQIFIQNFKPLDSPLLDDFRNNSKYIAQTMYNDVRYKGDPIDVSDNENEIKVIRPIIRDGVLDRNSLELVTTDKETKKVVTTPIFSDEALEYFNRKAIVNSAVKAAKYSMFDSFGNWKPNLNLDKQIESVAISAVQELYPKEVAAVQSGLQLGYDISIERNILEEAKKNLIKEIYGELYNQIDMQEE